jgi:hypothetical protein
MTPHSYRRWLQARRWRFASVDYAYPGRWSNASRLGPTRGGSVLGYVRASPARLVAKRVDARRRASALSSRRFWRDVGETEKGFCLFARELSRPDTGEHGLSRDIDERGDLLAMFGVRRRGKERRRRHELDPHARDEGLEARYHGHRSAMNGLHEHTIGFIVRACLASRQAARLPTGIGSSRSPPSRRGM